MLQDLGDVMGRSEDTTSESEEWGDDGWTVDCPCGITFDDGEEMVECDACRVWVHTRCCRVPKGLTHYICDRCRGEQHQKKIREEVEVAALLADLPSVKSTPFDERSPFFSTSSTSFPDSEGVLSLTERTLALQSRLPFDEDAAYDIPLSQRVHTHGVTGGEEAVLLGAPSFSKHLWRHQLMVPKPMDLQALEVPLHLPLEVDPPDLHGDDDDPARALRTQGMYRLRRGAQAKAERRKRLMEVVERYEQRRRQRIEGHRGNESEQRSDEVLLDDRSKSCTSSQGQAPVVSRAKPQVVSVAAANGNAYTSGSGDLSSPGGTASWTGGYVPRNPYALKKAAILEYMQTSQTSCASCKSFEALSWHEVKGLEGSVCDSCMVRHREQKYCPHCTSIYQEEEERLADPTVWLICSMCSRLVHKDCQAKKPLNGMGPAKRSNFLCSGCVREKKKARQEEGKRQMAEPDRGMVVSRASLKSSAVLRVDKRHSSHVASYDMPGLALEDECSRPGESFAREKGSGAALLDSTVSEHLKAPLLRLSIATGSGEEAGVEQFRDGFCQQVLLANGGHLPSPKAKKAAAIALAEKAELGLLQADASQGGLSQNKGPQDTEEAAGVPTPSGPEPELQRKDSDPGSTSVKNGDGRASGGEGTVESGSRKEDRHPSHPPCSPLAEEAPVLVLQHASDQPARPGSPSPSSSSNSSSSQARNLTSRSQQLPVQGGQGDLAAIASQDPTKGLVSPGSHNMKPKPPGRLYHSLSIPARPKALSVPPIGKKFLDFPDTPGSVTSEHKPSKHVQGASRPMHIQSLGRLVSSRPSHPTGLRLHSEGRPSLRYPSSNGSIAPPVIKKEIFHAPPLSKGVAEMPPPPPPVAPKRPAGVKAGSDLPPMNDEELALLLHQELNSSPRMPRVSRSKKPGANGTVVSKRSNSLLATPLKRSRSGEWGEGSKQESDEAEHGLGEVESVGEEKLGERVKLEPEENGVAPMKLGMAVNGVHSLPEIIESLGVVLKGPLEDAVDAVSKHWQNLRMPSGDQPPSLPRRTILEALSSREEWAHPAKQGLPVKRKRTPPSVLSDSGDDDSPRGAPARTTPPEEETTEGGTVLNGSRVARRKRSRRAVADFSDTSEADEGGGLKAPPSLLPNGGHHVSPSPKPAVKSTDHPPANGNGNHASKPHVNGHLHPPPGRSSSSGPLSNSSAEGEEALSHRQGPPRRKRSRIDARMELGGVRHSGGSGTPEED